MWGENLTKQDGFYRDILEQWEVDKYGFSPRGLFDLIYNTMRKVIDDNDKSDWAYEALVNCTSLLIWDIRYPWEYRPESMAKNRIDHAWSKLMYWLKITEFQKYGPITKMTRDPYIYLYCAAVILNRKQFIEVIKLPWYLYRPMVWRWYKYLLSPTERNRKLWLFWERFTFPPKLYGKRLKDYRKLAVNYLT